MEKEREPQAGERVVRSELERLVLASASPRRAEILSAVGWPFEACAADLDETVLEDEEAASYVQRLAHQKAAHVAGSRLFGLVLGADTTVVSPDGEILGKPFDEGDARRMLQTLNGRWHEVLTGVALVRAESGKSIVGLERTRVRFAQLSEREIEDYVMTGEPMDKAGAYAIQGRASLLIEGIEGDYLNVVGLPVRLVYKLALRFESAHREGKAEVEK